MSPDRLQAWLLALLFLAYLAVAFVWPSLRVWRQTGINPYVLPSTDDAHGFVTAGFRFALAALGVYLIAQALRPDIDRLLGPLQWLAGPNMRLAGWGLMLGALCWTVLAQAQMGKSWRIGIDRRNGTALVTGGLFAISRNPIFLGMRLSLLGLVMLRPNALTTSIALAADLFIQFQVRLEEEFLAGRHGSRYEEYMAATRRWL